MVDRHNGILKMTPKEIYMNEILKSCFYPTPKKLIEKMLSKIKGNPTRILEPSAGKGDIIEALIDARDDSYDHRFHGNKISAIEIDEDLQATLRGKNIKVIDSDFLNYQGADQFDLIIANPPFEDGASHLLKAINIMYRGEIIFLLNAETLRNPHTNERKELAKRLTELGADIEYMQNAFKDAERPAGVEVALVYINIERSVEEDLFKDVADKTGKETPVIEANYELSNKRRIEELVAEYNQTIEIGKETIIGYYKNYKKIGKYLWLNCKESTYEEKTDMTVKMQNQLNEMLESVRHDFWRKTLDLPEVRKRMTEKKRQEFEDKISKCCDMDFTENNIRQFVLNLIKGYTKTLTDGVLEIFDMFTIRHCYSGGLYDDNIHLFNGWKTNNAFKVGKRVIIPIYGGYGEGPFRSMGRWRLDYSAARKLHDIDVVMNYFDGMNSYVSITEALENAFEHGESRKIKSTYFTITVYMKGTMHLEFNDDNILRRFNVAACMGKNWLPGDYGSRHYNDCPEEEKMVIESFEGAESYTKNINQPVFVAHTQLLLE